MFTKKTLIEIRKSIPLLLCVFILGSGLFGCTPPALPEPAVEKDISHVYPKEIQPLKPEECGRCHPRYYNLIKNQGGKHRIDCKKCHVIFHTYRPGKVTYEEILPKCASCHENVHGEELALCSECHSEVHSPLNIPAKRSLEYGCSTCHPKLDKEIKTYTTQHTELYCISCHHTRHGYVPECMECHQPHIEEMTQIDCLTCHPPHKALQIVYPENIPVESCAICHSSAYEMLKESGTKHSAFSCTKCHPDKHRTIKRCRQCHGTPHGAYVMKKFRVCGQCHGVAHSLGKR